MEMKLKIFAALSEDINNGWVWLPDNIVSTRTVVKITNASTRKKVYCEAIQTGFNFQKRYNQQAKHEITDPSATLIINEWYRQKLGITKTQQFENLEVNTCDNIWGKTWASLHHPQIVVRLATMLGVLSVFLGVIGILLGIKGLK